VSNIGTATTAVDPETRETLLAYLDALALAEPIQERLWQEAGVTLAQVSVLRQLRRGPQTAGRLGQAAGLSPASLTRLVDRLEARGLVSRRRESVDRRCVEVHLQPEGERLLSQVKVVRGSDLHRAVQSMTAEESRRLRAALRDLIDRTRRLGTTEELR
jgi:DNA-binding MarR family transcriptional regulator